MLHNETLSQKKRKKGKKREKQQNQLNENGELARCPRRLYRAYVQGRERTVQKAAFLTSPPQHLDMCMPPNIK